MLHTASQAEQIGVRASADQIQLCVSLPINQQPLGLYMALTAAGILASQIVVSVLLGQRVRHSQYVNDRLQQIHVIVPLHAGFVILFELRGTIQF